VKTNDLISLLAEDAPVRLRLGRRLAFALIGGTAVAAILLLSTVGMRPDLASAIETARVQSKFMVTLALAIAACGLVFHIGRPGISLKPWIFALVAAPLLLAAAILTELAVLPETSWHAAMMGRYARFCVFFIPLLALGPLAFFLLALRQGAPESPGIAGAVAGLAAGGIAASIYASHCPDDSPLFVAVWYTTAIVIVTAIGGLIGSRLLRW